MNAATGACCAGTRPATAPLTARRCSACYLVTPDARPPAPARLLDVLAIVVAVAVTRLRGTVGGRVAVLVATGPLIGLIGSFAFGGDLTADVVSILASLLLAILVWPLAIASWKGRVRRA